MEQLPTDAPKKKRTNASSLRLSAGSTVTKVYTGYRILSNASLAYEISEGRIRQRRTTECTQEVRPPLHCPRFLASSPNQFESPIIVSHVTAGQIHAECKTVQASVGQRFTCVLSAIISEPSRREKTSI